MKKKIVLFVVIAVIVFCMGATLETLRDGFKSLRAAVAADDTAHTVTTSKYADVPSYAKQLDPAKNAIEVAFTGGADAQSCVAYVYLCRHESDVVLAWYGTITAGKQVSTAGTYYVDTIVTTLDNWIATITLVDEGGADRISRLMFDTCGYDKVWVMFTGLSSESFTALYAGY